MSLPDKITEPITPEDWFKRPVKFLTFSFGTGTMDLFSDPLNSWLSDTFIQSKLRNTRYIRPKFKIRITVTSNPLIYGHFLTGLVHGTNNGANVTYKKLCEVDHAVLSPAGVNEVVLDVPWTYIHDYYTLTTAGTAIDRTLLGNTSAMPYPFILRSIGEVAFSTTASTFPGASMVGTIWCEELDTAQPYATQSGRKDEYSVPNISKTGTAFAAELNKITHPIIAPAARATAMAVSVGSGVASAFGYSRPAIIAEPMYTIPSKYGDQFSTTTSRPVARLTADVKQEIAIGGSDTVATLHDELTFDRLNDCWTYVTSGSIAIGTFSGSIFAMPVTPCIVNATPVPNWNHYSRSSILAHSFNYWRGDITYRIRIDSTVYHSGQLMISWNPSPGTTVFETPNRNPNVLIDVNGTKEVMVTVRYGQAVPYLKTRSWIAGTTRDFSQVGTFDNGELALTVYSAMVGANNPIRYTIWQMVEPGADYHTPSDFVDRAKFNNPTTAYPTASVAALSSIVIQNAINTNAPLTGRYIPQSGNATDAVTDSAGRYYFGGSMPESRGVMYSQGQRFRSVRPYMKRNNPLYRWGVTGKLRMAVDIPNFVRSPHICNNIAAGYVETNFINIFATSFLGYRGSQRFSVSPGTPADESSVIITPTYTLEPIAPVFNPAMSTFISENEWNRLRGQNYNFHHGVQAFGRDQELSFELPYFNRGNYYPTVDRNSMTSANGPLPILSREMVTATAVFQCAAQIVSIDTSIGEDFNYFFPMIPGDIWLRSGTHRPHIFSTIDFPVVPPPFALPLLVTNSAGIDDDDDDEDIIPGTIVPVDHDGGDQELKIRFPRSEIF